MYVKHECIGDDKGENVEPDDNDVIENIKCEEAFDINAKVTSWDELISPRLRQLA